MHLFGQLQSILVREIVPGDPIQLEEGDRIVLSRHVSESASNPAKSTHVEQFQTSCTIPSILDLLAVDTPVPIDDGRRVINYAQWRSKEDWVASGRVNDDEASAAILEVLKRYGATPPGGKVDFFRVAR